MFNLLRSLVLPVTVLLLAAHLPGCGDDDANPLSPEEQALVGIWRLDVGGVDPADFSCVYDLDDDHRVSNRLGGAFLRSLRDLEVLQDVDLGQLRNLDAIDGAAVRWRGTWSVSRDSLRFELDQFQVDAIGTLPLLGEVSVPVYRKDLTASQRVVVVYNYQVSEQRLVLRGAAASAGLASDAMGEQTAHLDPLGQQALAVTARVLAEAYRGSAANEFVYVRD